MMINGFDFMLKALFVCQIFVFFLDLKQVIKKGEVKFQIFKVTVNTQQTIAIQILPNIPRNTMKFHTTRQGNLIS